MSDSTHTFLFTIESQQPVMKSKKATRFLKPSLAEQSRLNRMNNTILLRKKKKDERMMKRRMDGLMEMKNHSNALVVATTTTPNQSKELADTSPRNNLHNNTIEDVPTLLNQSLQIFANYCNNPVSMSPTIVLEKLRNVRRALSRSTEVADSLVTMGFLGYLVAFLQHNDNDIVFETEWILTNISSTDSAHDVAKSGAVQFLAANLVHQHAPIRLQAAWCIGNIAGESQEYRHGLLALPEVMHGMKANLDQPESGSLLQNFAWATSSLCRDKPPFPAVQPFVAPLATALLKLNTFDRQNDKIRKDIVWALSYIAEIDTDAVESIVRAGVLGSLMKIFEKTTSRTLLIPTVRTIGSIAAGSTEQTDRLLSAGFLKHAVTLLDHPSINIRKDICWILSNIAAGTHEQIQALIKQMKTAGLLKKVVEKACNSPFDVRQEAAWVLCNIVSGGTQKQICILVEIGGVIDAFAQLLNLRNEPSILIIVLQSLHKLFGPNKYASYDYTYIFDEQGGLETLEELQDHANNEVSDLAISLAETYFDISEDEDVDEDVVPETAEDGMFTFGISKNLIPTSPLAFG